ncbi:uncharacterized protein IL334_000938 [Kwoniella shivajii]|uniref:Uncharacterized protein n=1 Tax=Kwoniella shivajii TaxID=564305 RepID=A0ABZ1CTM5_9TREE|nr:hypothetical protein IL334_000938 [Kwoniella shivajii]
MEAHHNIAAISDQEIASVHPSDISCSGGSTVDGQRSTGATPTISTIEEGSILNEDNTSDHSPFQTTLESEQHNPFDDNSLINTPVESKEIQNPCTVHCTKPTLIRITTSPKPTPLNSPSDSRDAQAFITRPSSSSTRRDHRANETTSRPVQLDTSGVDQQQALSDNRCDLDYCSSLKALRQEMRVSLLDARSRSSLAACSREEDFIDRGISQLDKALRDCGIAPSRDKRNNSDVGM